MLKEIASEIWSKLGANVRANGATTIAVVKCADDKMYCTSNDVSQISAEATAAAKAAGITPIDGNYISKSGAGFHAEMWAVIQAMSSMGPSDTVASVIKLVGASRPCCKNCTDVLDLLAVEKEEASSTLYKSWYNPITVGEDCCPRPGFEKLQRRSIPDFRNHSADYWFTPGTKKDYQKTAPDSAK